MSAFRVLFVCTGNTCRSAMAKALFERLLEEENRRDIEVLSAGAMTGGGSPASEGATVVCRELGVDLSQHVSTALSVPLVTWADMILCMENHHVAAVVDRIPAASSKTHLLGEFGPPEDSLEIADPVGLPVSHYRGCRDRILECLRGLLEKIPHEEDRRRTVALGWNEAGSFLAHEIGRFLEENSIEVLEFGEGIPGDSLSPAVDVGRRVAGKVVQTGIVVGATGIGMGIVANKVPGVRAVVCTDPLSARQGRELFDCNVLCLPGSGLDRDSALRIVRVWLESRYEGGERADWPSLCERLEYGYS